MAFHSKKKISIYVCVVCVFARVHVHICIHMCTINLLLDIGFHSFHPMLLYKEILHMEVNFEHG